MLDKLILLYNFKDVEEAQVIKDMLAQKNITASIRSFNDSAFDGIYEKQFGGGEILVREQDSQNAKKVLSDFLSMSVSVPKATPEDIEWEAKVEARRKWGRVEVPLFFGVIFLIIGVFSLTIRKVIAFGDGLTFFVFGIFFLVVSYFNLKKNKKGRPQG
jgi:hypothetical protein